MHGPFRLDCGEQASECMAAHARISFIGNPLYSGSLCVRLTENTIKTKSPITKMLAIVTIVYLSTRSLIFWDADFEFSFSLLAPSISDSIATVRWGQQEGIMVDTKVVCIA